jgi:hypothetical protein
VPAAPAGGSRPARPAPPPEVVACAEERAEARARRDWPRADALKATIEAAGWKVEDAGRGWSLFPAVSPDVLVDGILRYGSARSVPSVLGDPPEVAATVGVVAEGDPEAFERLVRSLRAHAPAGTHVVVVGNDPDPAWDARLAAAAAAPDAGDGGPDVEVVRTSEALGAAAAANAGMRRARGAMVVLAATTIELTGDAISPLVAALADPGVAVAGAFGTAATELPHLVETAAVDPDAIDGAWLAFRRDDYERLGPLDEHFVVSRFLDAWWSLALRAGGDPDAPPRRAVRLDLPVVRHEEGHAAAPARRTAEQSRAEARRDRLARRNGYRLIDRFGDRPDLLAARSLTAAGGRRD